MVSNYARITLRVRKWRFSCLRFCAAPIYIDNCPMRCNTKQSIILQVHCTCFRCQPHPSSGVHKTVTTASGTVQLPPSNVAKLTWPRWRVVAAQKLWPVPEAVVTVLCTPDDGCGWHPKHVQWICRIINRLLCVASRWTAINTRPIEHFSDIFVTNLPSFLLNCCAYHNRLPPTGYCPYLCSAVNMDIV